MKEHEDDVIPSVDKPTAVIVSTAVDKDVSEKIGDGEGKTLGFLTEKGQDEDVMVDVVGPDAVEEDDHGRTGVDLDGNSGSEELVMQKETETHDQVMEGVAGSGEDGDASVETRVLKSEKTEVVVNEEEVAGSSQDCNVSVETRVLTSEKVEVSVASGSNGDIAVTDSKELNVKSVEEVVDRKIVESSVSTGILGSQVVAEDSVSIDPRSVCVNNQSSAVEVVSSRTDEVDESNKEDDNLHPTSKVITDDAQETTDGDFVVNEKIEKENEDIDVVVVDHDLTDKDEAQDEIVEKSSLVTEVVSSETGDENLDQQGEVDKLHEKESFNPATEVITETVLMVNNEAEKGLTKNKDIIEQATEPVQDVVFENGVMDGKTGKEDEIVDSLKIPESLTTVNADIDRGVDAGMDVKSGAEKDQDFNIAAKSVANLDQKLPESSSGSVLTQHREEHIKSREPIVYGRRVHVEVPIYESSLDVDKKLPESSSPVSEDENLKIETDSDSEEDDDNNEEDVDDDDDESELESGNLISLHQTRYFKPPENEGAFSVSDLVWGKVRSHPWWPGQIIDPLNASKKAMKYYKKDTFLVAYFGDHSFAWNNSSVLKPFRANFSQNEKQTNTEIFKTAVDSALEEVSRRVELGLACSCVPEDNLKEIENQVIENAGVAKKLKKKLEKDESASVNSFEPDKLVDYVRLLAQFPAQSDKMDVAIAKAQLSSYVHFKGYRELPEFLNCGDMLEDDPIHEEVEKVYKNGEKLENEMIEIANPNKEISLSDVTDDAPESVVNSSKSGSSSGLKKRKARVSISNGSVKRPNRPPTKVAVAPVSTPKPSFKVGALIQRVASQLTGPVVKSGSDLKVDHGQKVVDHGQNVDQNVQTAENPQMEGSVAEMLSQLHLTAQDPMKDYSFFQTIVPFFYERRASVFSKSLKKTPTVEKPESDTKKNPPNENEPEEFEFDFDFDFDDVNDSYWTDRIVQNHSEDQPLEETQNGGVEEYAVVEHEPEKPAKRKRRSNKKQKRVASRDEEPEPEPVPEVEEESELVRKRRENLATEVLLKFEEGINFCSVIQLNKMFRRFGPLMESETEVDRDGGRARVVFKKCFDAEVAHNSAGRFNIFGSVNVSYELNYSPLVSYKPLPLPLLQEDHMDAS